MNPPVEKEVHVLRNNVDWRESWNFYLTNTTEPDDFTNCDLFGALVLGSNRVEVTTDDGTLVVNGNTVSVVVDREVMKTLPAGVYDGDLRVARPGGVDTALLVFKRKVEVGVS